MGERFWGGFWVRGWAQKGVALINFFPKPWVKEVLKLGSGLINNFVWVLGWV